MLGIAYSKTVRGVGTFSTGPYGCYDSAIGEKSCFNATSINATWINQTIYDLSNNLKIDNLTNLLTSWILVYVGTADRKVTSSVASLTATILDWFSNNTDAVKLVWLAGANHTFPTTSFGSACSKSQPPFMAACHYDLAFVTIDFLYGNGATYPTKFD